VVSRVNTLVCTFPQLFKGGANESPMPLGAARCSRSLTGLRSSISGNTRSAFAENDIDFALFTTLTDADLKELGITSLGHRKRLLEAIANLDKVATRSTPSMATLPGAATPTAPSAEAAGERRHVTVAIWWRFDRYRGPVGCRGMARSGRRLPRCRDSGSD
jgi:SAM domain (Sterile alpha motif)